MYEPWDDASGDQWYARTYSPPTLDRLTHLVLVDGRMVDLWTEPVQGTRWQQYADRFDAERRPAPEPAPPPYDVALDWLRSLVGGAAALDQLDTHPLREVGRPPLDDQSLPVRRRLQASVEAIDRVAGVLVEAELKAALLNALWLVWARAPAQVTTSTSSDHVVAGLVHVVGKANGAFSPTGPHTQREVAAALGLKGSLAGRAHGVEQALRGFRPDARHPRSLPDLLAVGEPSLLVSATRRDVVRWRDLALRARDEHVLP